MNIEIRRITKAEIEDYERLVHTSNEGTIFHESWWLDTFKKVYRHGYSVQYIGLFQEPNLLAAIPIPVHRRIGINFIHNPKLTPYLGPMFSQELLKGKRVSHISKQKEANSLFAKVLKKSGLVLYYPFSLGHIDLQPYKWTGFKIGVHYTYTIDLNQPLEEIWAEMDKRRRNEIRKVDSLNPEIAKDELKSFITLNEMSFKRQRKKYNLKKFWKMLFEECSKRGQCKVWTAYIKEEPVASVFLVWDNRRAYYLGGGIKDNSHGTMSLLLWKAIKFSKKRGLKIFDFEGSDVPSIEKYFREFGGKIQPVYYIEHNSIKTNLMLNLYFYLKEKNIKFE